MSFVEDLSMVAGLDRQNATTFGRILGRGTVGHAEPVESPERPDVDEPVEVPAGAARLVNHSKGTAILELDGPGYYWYESRTGNDAGRGLTGAIVVR